MSKEELDDLMIQMSKYHEYVNNIISKIKDFDIWYETTYGNNFPKEWYTFIKMNEQKIV